MSGEVVRQAKEEKADRLTRRDWILLPGLGLLTIVIVAGSTELIARQVYYSQGGADDCLVLNDPSTGVRGIPNSVCRQKIPEGRLMEYRFNNCGHRAGMECGPKPSSTYRIVMTGTSFAMGLGVPREQTFAALLPVELSERTGRKVELYNESISLESPHAIALNFDAVLAAKPDMILWILTYWDVKNVSLVLPRDEIYEESPEGSEVTPAAAGAAPVSSPAPGSATSILTTVRNLWHDMQSNVLLNHLMFEYGSQSQYLKRCRIWSDDAQYLGATPSKVRLLHLKEFDGYAASIAARAKAAGVQFVAGFVPKRPQAALIANGIWPADIDPFSLDNELRSIVVSHGGTWLDTLSDFRAIPNAELGYFPVDGHPNPEGHAMISRLLARQLTGGAIPALAVATLKTAAEPTPAAQSGK